MVRAFAVLTAVFAFLLVLAGRPAAGGEVLECVLARVNNEIITLSDYERQKKSLLEEIYRQKLPEEDTRKHLDEARDQLLPSMIEEKLLLQKATDLGLTTTKDEVDRIVRSIMQENKIVDEADLGRRLQEEGMSADKLRANIERRSVIEKVKQYEIASKVVVTEEESRRYYEEHREDFREPVRLRLREIVLLTERRPEDEVHKEIEEIAALVRNGADFAELATLFSQAPTAEHGGDLGLLREADLSPEVATPAAALEPGQVSAPIRTRYGWHLLKLGERKPVVYRTFEEARDQIVRSVQESRYGEKVGVYLQKLKASAFIHIHEECLKHSS